MNKEINRLTKLVKMGKLIKKKYTNIITLFIEIVGNTKHVYANIKRNGVWKMDEVYEQSSCCIDHISKSRSFLEVSQVCTSLSLAPQLHSMLANI